MHTEESRWAITTIKAVYVILQAVTSIRFKPTVNYCMPVERMV